MGAHITLLGLVPLLLFIVVVVALLCSPFILAHFGIRLEQDRSDSNVWQVLRWWEGGDKLLMTITNEQGASNQAVLPIAAGAARADR